MNIERARELTAGCVRTGMAVVFGHDYVALPEASLEELLVANRLVSEEPRERGPNGGYLLRAVCDPRLVALHYAFENYGSDPRQMLEALGFELAHSD